MANDEIKFLPIFQILDIKNIWFLLELEMALATAIKNKFESVWIVSYALIHSSLLSTWLFSEICNIKTANLSIFLTG